VLGERDGDMRDMEDVEDAGDMKDVGDMGATRVGNLVNGVALDPVRPIDSIFFVSDVMTLSPSPLCDASKKPGDQDGHDEIDELDELDAEDRGVSIEADCDALSSISGSHSL
jgi:hypothetical protein